MENKPRQLIAYVNPRGQSPFREWLKALRDEKGRAAIHRRLKRIEQGGLGDWKRFGVITELRVDFGPGYRIYAGQDGPVMVVLLAGGDKSTQGRDILKAKEYWHDYETRKNQR